MLKRLYKENPYIGLLMIFSVLIIFMFLEMKNHRFQLVDYEVYYKAAHRVINGENLFRVEDGFYKYKYSPVAATYFIPFISFPLEISKIVFWILSAFIITSLIFINTSLAFFGKKYDSLIVNNITLLCGLFLAVHYMLDIHLGQVNFLIFTMYSLSVWLYIRRKDLLWPLVLAMSIFIKPFALIFIPYLVLKGKFKQIGLLITFLFLLAALPLFFYEIPDLTFQYKSWFYELVTELKNKQSLMSNSNHTIFSILARNL